MEAWPVLTSGSTRTLSSGISAGNTRISTACESTGPNIPPYLLDSIFLDFGRHARREAAVLGFDFDRMRGAAAALYRRLHGGLHDSDLSACAEAESPGEALRRIAPESAGLLEWIRFKARLVGRLHAGFRKTMDEAGAGHMELWSNAFPPPWNTLSGMDYGVVGRYSTAISVKLYTMHWPMMLRFYGDQLRRANPRDLRLAAGTGSGPPVRHLR